MNIRNWARPFALLLGLLIGISTPPTEAHAQSGVVLYYDHVSGELHYAQAGDDATDRRVGLSRDPDAPDILPIAQGGRACFQVVNGNPLLYTYAASSEAITVREPQELATVLAGVRALVSSGPALQQSSAMSPDAPSPGDTLARMYTQLSTRDALVGETQSLAKYAEQIHTLARALDALEQLRLETDEIPDFQSSFDRAEKLHAVFDGAVRSADEAFSKAEATSKETQTVKAQLRLAQQVLEQRGSATMREFSSALRLSGKQICSDPIDSNRMRLTLSIQAAANDPQGSLDRATGDKVVVVDLDPHSEANFRLAPGALLGPRVDRKAFGLSDGVLTVEEEDDPLLRVGVFAEGRLWENGWLWASLGVATSGDTTPDLFFGLVANPSISLSVAQLRLGAGLGLYHVAESVSSGQEGEPLPNDAGDIEELIERSYEPAFAIVFSISGLELGGN